MDRQHHLLIDAMNRLAARDASGAPKQETLRLLDQLTNVTLQHFHDEEAYMAEKAYPKLDTHKRIHAELVTQLQSHIAAFRAGASSRLNPKMLEFLKFWLAAHICGIDKQYAEHTRTAHEHRF
jgi:hemerythrin-like metal-binding protein